MITEIISYLPLSAWILIGFLTLHLLWKIFDFYYKTTTTNKLYEKLVEGHNKLTEGYNKLTEEHIKLVEAHNKLTESHNWLISYFNWLINYLFGSSRSPLVLKPEYKEVLLASDIDEQIEEKKQQIVDLIQSQNPPTPFDAQIVIQNNIRQIISWLDLTDLKNKMYKAGLPPGSEIALISLYLYEIIIPLLKFGK